MGQKRLIAVKANNSKMYIGSFDPASRAQVLVNPVSRVTVKFTK